MHVVFFPPQERRLVGFGHDALPALPVARERRQFDFRRLSSVRCIFRSIALVTWGFKEEVLSPWSACTVVRLGIFPVQ